MQKHATSDCCMVIMNKSKAAEMYDMPRSPKQSALWTQTYNSYTTCFCGNRWVLAGQETCLSPQNHSFHGLLAAACDRGQVVVVGVIVQPLVVLCRGCMKFRFVERFRYIRRQWWLRKENYCMQKIRQERSMQPDTRTLGPLRVVFFFQG